MVAVGCITSARASPSGEKLMFGKFFARARLTRLVACFAVWSLCSICGVTPGIREVGAEPRAYPHFQQPTFSWRGGDGAAIPDEENRKAKDGFGAQLLVTKDQDLWEQWAKLPP